MAVGDNAWKARNASAILPAGIPQSMPVSPRETFLQRGLRLWFAISLFSLALGITAARIATHCAADLRGSLILGVGIFGFSLLLCRPLSEFLWNKRNSNAVLIGLAIPMTSITPITVAGHLVSGNAYMGRILYGMCGLPIATGLLYLGGVSWGIAAGRWRQQLAAQDPTSAD